MMRYGLGRIGLSMTAACWLGSGASAAPAAAWLEPQPVFVMERVPLRAFLVDGKDERLAAALAMVPHRLRELPQEGADIPPEGQRAIDMAMMLLASGGRMGITYNPGNPTGLFGYGVTLQLETEDEGRARTMERNVRSLLRDMPMRPTPRRSTRYEGLTSFATPLGSIDFGPFVHRGRSTYTVVAGSVDDLDQGFGTLPAREGYTPILRGRLDLSALTPGFEMAKAMAPVPMLAEIDPMLREWGLIGEDAIRADFFVGHGEQDSYSSLRLLGAQAHAARLGLSTTPLTEEQLRVIPADAVMAWISRMDLSSVQDVLDMLSNSGVAVNHALAEFRDVTGVDLLADVIEPLGDTVAFYTSDSTGGWSLLSGVVLLGVDDRQTLAGAHTKLVAMLHHAMMEDEFASRYVRLHAWRHDGIDLMSLRFQGVPVPFELTYALTDDWLIVSLTPQAVIAAARQAAGRGDGGLVTNANFARAMPAGSAPLSIDFLDTPRIARSGYPFVSMLGSAIANGTRSPFDGRDPGLVVPTLPDLLRDARASVTVTRWVGDDYVMESSSDRSALVQAAGLAGVGVQIAPAIAAAVVPSMMAQPRHRHHHHHHHGGWGLLDDQVVRSVLTRAAARGTLHAAPWRRFLVAAAMARLDDSLATMPIRQDEAGQVSIAVLPGN